MGCGGASAPAPAAASPVSAAVAPPAPAAPIPPTLRLAPLATPTGYHAELEVDPAAPSFAGRVEIGLAVAAPTRVIWLNAKALTVTAARLVAGGQTIAAEASPVAPELLRIDLASPVPAGEAALELRYTAALSDQTSAGLFVMRSAGDAYAFTQLEDTDARSVFPCFDEPGWKTPWQLTLVVPRELTAVSNTPVVDSTDEGDKRRVQFAQTSPLPSYLVAFAVGPLERVAAGKTAGGAPLAVLTPRGRAAEARFTARHPAEITRRLETYFGVPYPYAKLDNVGRPDGLGAMENAGLIISGGAIVLADPTTESADFRKRAAAVTAHETAHMWFGDLVTMAWWDDVWLNEAFATWLAAKTFAVRPDLSVEEQRAEYRSNAMAADVSTAARKIRQPIASANDIANAFDAITYDKGAAVLRMSERYVGEAEFQKGVTAYLTTHAHANATTADFVAAIATAAGKDVAPMFASFVDQPGLPAVEMSLRCADGKGLVALAQRRMLALGAPAGVGAEGHWQVPVCIVAGGGGGKPTTACTLLTAPAGEIALATCPKWIHGNAGGAGYYLPLLAGDLLDRLLSASAALGVEERLGLIADLELLVTSGALPADRGLAAVETLARGAAPEVLLRLVHLVDELTHRALVDDAARPGFARWVARVFGARARALGWSARKGEPDTVRRLRPDLVSLVATHGADAGLAAGGRKVAERWIADRRAADPDAVFGALRVAAYTGDAGFVARLRAVLARGDANERQLLAKTLLEVTDAAALRAALGLFLDGTLHPREFRYFRSFDNPTASRDEMFHFVRDNYEAYVKRVPEQARAALLYSGRALCDEAAAREYTAFFAERAAALLGGPRVYAQQRERIATCSAVRAVQAPRITAFVGGAR